MFTDYTPTAPTQVREPFHRDGWVYEEKVARWRMLARLHRDGRELTGRPLHERRGRCERDRLCNPIVSTHQAGRQHETLLTAGQTAGGITEILPVSEIIRRLIGEAQAALSRTPRPR